MKECQSKYCFTRCRMMSVSSTSIGLQAYLQDERSVQAGQARRQMFVLETLAAVFMFRLETIGCFKALCQLLLPRILSVSLTSTQCLPKYLSLQLGSKWCSSKLVQHRSIYNKSKSTAFFFTSKHFSQLYFYDFIEKFHVLGA